MRTEIQVFTSEKFGQVRTVDINNMPYFVGKDVAEILGYANTNKAIQMHVDDEDKKILDFKGFSHFGTDLWGENDFSNKIIINESGLYSLILSSKLPMGCNIKSGIIPAMNFYFNRGQKLTTAQTGCLWNAYEEKFNMICDVLTGSHHDYLLSQRDLRGFVIHLALSENWSENDLRTFVNGLKNKPNRDTVYELSAYNFRNWYNRKVHGKLRNLKSLGEKNKANVTLDALCTLAEGYTNDKLVRSFAWKNRAKGVLDTGYNIAQQRFIALTAESQSRIEMEE